LARNAIAENLVLTWNQRPGTNTAEPDGILTTAGLGNDTNRDIDTSIY
jgi:hypothetical protein